MTGTRALARRWSDRLTLFRAVSATMLGAVGSIIGVFIAFGGSFQTPAAAIQNVIRHSYTVDSTQNVALSDLRLSLEAETQARRGTDSLLLGRQLEARFYLRMLALDRCISRRQAGTVPSSLEPYCDRLQRGLDLPNPLTP